jgi:hypothetical protein
LPARSGASQFVESWGESADLMASPAVARGHRGIQR